MTVIAPAELSVFPPTTPMLIAPPAVSERLLAALTAPVVNVPLEVNATKPAVEVTSPVVMACIGPLLAVMSPVATMAPVDSGPTAKMSAVPPDVIDPSEMLLTPKTDVAPPEVRLPVCTAAKLLTVRVIPAVRFPELSAICDISNKSVAALTAPAVSLAPALSETAP